MRWDLLVGVALAMFMLGVWTGFRFGHGRGIITGYMQSQREFKDAKGDRFMQIYGAPSRGHSKWAGSRSSTSGGESASGVPRSGASK